VNVPSELNIQQLAEIGMQLTGMTAAQAREFCQMVDWKSTLVLPVPRSVDSYSVVEVNGVEGTLITQVVGGRLSYFLMWVKNGIIYGLAGVGDPKGALTLADSIN
jgi:hypothetical protein